MSLLFRADQLLVRTHEESDLSAILAVYQDCEDFLSLGPVAKASMAMVLADIEHSQNGNGLYCAIDSNEKQTVGILDFTPQVVEGTSMLSLLMISLHHRRKGYGRAVATALELYLRSKLKTQRIESGVQVNNPTGIRFWMELGYRIAQVPRHLDDQTVAYEMVKTIQ
jgi:ribosomal protein S18 acetylase RimI-like enzyme